MPSLLCLGLICLEAVQLTKFSQLVMRPRMNMRRIAGSIDGKVLAASMDETCERSLNEESCRSV